MPTGVGTALATGVGGALASKAVGSAFGGGDSGGATQETGMTRSRPEWVERELQNLYNQAQEGAGQAFQPVPFTNMQEAALARQFYGADRLQPELTDLNSQLKGLATQKAERVGARENPQKITTRSNPQAITTQRFTEAMKNGAFDPYRELVLNPELAKYDTKAARDYENQRILNELGGKRYSSAGANTLRQQQEAGQTGRNDLQAAQIKELANIFQTDEERNLKGQESQANIYKQDILNELAAQEAQGNINNQDIGRELQAALANQQAGIGDITRQQSLWNDIINNVYKQSDLSRLQTQDLLAGGEMQENKQREYNQGNKAQIDWLNGMLQGQPSTSQSTYGVAPNKTLSQIGLGSDILQGLNKFSGNKIGESLGDWGGGVFGNANKSSNQPSYYAPIKLDNSFNTGQQSNSGGGGGNSRYFNPYK